MQSKKLRPGLCPMKPVRTCNRNCAHPMTSYCKTASQTSQKVLYRSDGLRTCKGTPLWAFEAQLVGSFDSGCCSCGGYLHGYPGYGYDLKHRQCKRLQICVPWKGRRKAALHETKRIILAHSRPWPGAAPRLPLWPPDRGEQDRDGTGYSLDGVTPDTSRTVNNTCAGAPLSAGQMPFFYQTKSHLSTNLPMFLSFLHTPLSLYLYAWPSRLSTHQPASLSLCLSLVHVHVSRMHLEKCFAKHGAQLAHICFKRGML